MHVRKTCEKTTFQSHTRRKPQNCDNISNLAWPVFHHCDTVLEVVDWSAPHLGQLSALPDFRYFLDILLHIETRAAQRWLQSKIETV